MTSAVVDLSLRRASADELAARARQGSEAAFQELARRFTGLTRGIAALYFMPGYDRDDVHQEAMVGLHKAARDFRDGRGAKFATFAEMVIHRHLANAARLANGKKHAVLTRRVELRAPTAEVDNPEPEDRLGLFVDPASDPHDVVLAQNDFATFRRFAKGALSPLEQEVMGLWLSDLSYEQIAERTGEDIKAIDNALQRVRRKASEHLAAAA